MKYAIAHRVTLRQPWQMHSYVYDTKDDAVRSANKMNLPSFRVVPVDVPDTGEH